MNRQLINRWHNSQELEQHGLPDIVHQWLGGSGSMTHAMRELTENNLTLEVLASEPQLINSTEAELLGLDNDQTLFTREILMKQDDEPLLYGRSVFPASLATEEMAVIEALGTKPLGDVLFKLNAKPRMSMQYALLDNDAYLYQALSRHLPQSKPLYARRSIFNYHQDNVLVQEIFLSPHPVYALASAF